MTVRNELSEVLGELEAAAVRLGIKVTYEPIQATVAGGGLCKVKGAYRVIIDKRSTVGEKVATLARSIVGVAAKTGGDAGEVSEKTREVLASYQATAA